MRVSERLQQSLWASALVMSMAVIQSPTMTFGQSESSAGFKAASSSPGSFQPAGLMRANLPVDKNTQAEAKRFLLKARQALAHSDVETAKAMTKSATQFSIDFTTVGDSPSTLDSMINRQLELAKLAKNGDRTYNAGAASFLLTQAEALVYYQDFETAKMLIAQARKFPVEFNANIGDPDQLEKMINLAMSNNAVAQPAQAVATSTKSETMKLLSQAQLAMDQENWTDAKSFVDRAKALGVPQNQFADNEARPWQLELKIQNALNRRAFDPAVVQTNFETQTENQATQADYNPGTDKTHNVAASTMNAPAAELSFNSTVPNANESYQLGLRALNQNNSEAAKAYFTAAWNARTELDPVIVQVLQDQLSRLTMSAAPMQQASQASGVMAIDDPQPDAKVLYREIQRDVFKQRDRADKMMQSDPRAAIEIITAARGQVAQSQLDANTQRPLLNMIDNDITEMQKYIRQNLSQIETREANDERMESVEFRRQNRSDVEKQIQKLVDQFNELVEEKRFEEALIVARQAHDLDSESAITVLLIEKANIIRNLRSIQDIRDRKADSFLRNINDVEESTISNDPGTPMQHGDAETWRQNSTTRLKALEERRYGTGPDRKIWDILRNQRVQGEYRSTLANAMDELSRQAGVNIVFDDLALVAENIQRDRQIDVPIREPISLQSALEVILQSAGLVFVVENEVIKITSRQASQAKRKTTTYYIGDLVMPMRPPTNPMAVTFNTPNMNGTMGNSYGGNFNVGNNSNGSQLQMAQQLGNAPNQANPFGGFNNNRYGGGGTQTGIPVYGTVGPQPMGGITLSDFIPLIDLIQNTIASDSWEDTGTGLGTIQAFPNNLSLIVSQTQEVQDEIQDLLKKLRELNDVQIVVEVRFITLRDSFFERVGIDFDFSINDSGTAGINPNGDVQTNGSTIVGQQPIDSTPFTPTTDLDLQFLQGSFSAAEPIFGGFSGATAASFGFAILSDIEVFFLIQASKGDSRTNITQAPTVTMFNGQSASINDGSTRPFVTSVIPVVGDFAVAHQPVITLLPDGTNLNVTAVVSADRRFVRLQLVPFFSQVTSVENFTFDGSTTTRSVSGSLLDDLLDIVDGGGDDDGLVETTTQGITIQLPVLAGTTLNTVVSVPDGGTVLMGGVKRMSEGRQESGVPMLSNLPYISRLFKNVSIGHETSNLMMMVTPRIIIQKEIEEDQTGVNSGY